MPFITARVLSVVRDDTAPLGFVSAGPDQSVLCATLVQLEAVIIGDITQHTFEWEQSFGTPVTLINPNTLTPSFVNPQTSEIIFTFYTDRGTPFEQSDDVLISRRPTDIFRNSLGTGADPNTGGTGSLTTSNVVLPQFRDLNVRLTNNTYNPSNEVITGGGCEDYMITWDRPDSRTVFVGSTELSYTFVGSYYETRSGTNWIDKTFVSADQNHISVAAGQYRLTTIWRHAVTGLVTRDVEIIHTAGLTAPSGRPGGVEALRGVVGAASTNNLIIIIQNPRKISKSETDTLARSIGDATSNEVTNLVRGSGVQKDLGIDTLKQSIGDATFGGDIVVTRNNGASIG